MMTAKQIIAMLLAATGQFSKIKFQSIVATSAQFKDVQIKKVTTAVVRSGIDFSKLASVINSISSGERTEVKPLPWGTWINFPYVIGHKEKEYVRLYPSSAPNHIPSVTYFVNGIETAKNEILQYLTKSNVEKLLTPSKPECFTLTTTNILDLEEVAK